MFAALNLAVWLTSHQICKGDVRFAMDKTKEAPKRPDSIQDIKVLLAQTEQLRNQLKPPTNTPFLRAPLNRGSYEGELYFSITAEESSAESGMRPLALPIGQSANSRLGAQFFGKIMKRQREKKNTF